MAWTGNDAGTFIESFVLEQSTDAGPFAEVWRGLGTFVDLRIEPGHTYRFRVKAVDANANWSGYRTGSSYAVGVVRESSPRITGWGRVALRATATPRFCFTWGVTPARICVERLP